MPIFAGLVGSLFSALAVYLAKFLTVRVAAIAAAVTTFGVLTLGLFAAAVGLTSTLTVAFPSIVMTGVWLMLPDNLVPCFAAIIATDTVVALYRWNTSNVRIAASVS